VASSDSEADHSARLAEAVSVPIAVARNVAGREDFPQGAASDPSGRPADHLSVKAAGLARVGAVFALTGVARHAERHREASGRAPVSVPARARRGLLPGHRALRGLLRALAPGPLSADAIVDHPGAVLGRVLTVVAEVAPARVVPARAAAIAPSPADGVVLAAATVGALDNLPHMKMESLLQAGTPFSRLIHDGGAGGSCRPAAVTPA
jgi:hypothetical protein